ncbi:peptidoglycan recognition family protein [Mesorhizobium sp. M0678]|uniref:peptidoglycan recognition protein family protein n=1 Tax=Mesorhizobium sp. M0678 TaxID=2956985 RepID=UPI003337AB02
MIIPSGWLPNATIQRVILHWTAGSHKATDFDREHYHLLIEGDGKLIRGIPSIDLNSLPKAKAGYAGHTLNCNTGSIGVSMCAMAGAIERPFKAGSQPLTKAQWDVASTIVAELCRRYTIPVGPKTVLSHAEVQANLGIQQRGKWDIAKLPFDPAFDTARECGDRFRAEVKAKL